MASPFEKDYVFLRQCYAPGTSHKTITHRLRKLGKPPRNLSIGKSITKLSSVVEAFGALSCCTQVSFSDVVVELEENWKNVYEPWTTTLMELVLDDTQEPTTPEEQTLFSRILIVLSFCLDFPQKHRASLNALSRMTPDLPALVSQVLIKVLHIGHRTWRYWAGVLSGLSDWRFVDQSATHPPNLRTRPQGPYTDELEIGVILLRHLKSLLPGIPKMNTLEMHRVTSFLHCTNHKYRTPQESQMWILHPAIAGDTVRVLCRLGHLLLCKRKALRDATAESDEFETTALVVVLVLAHLTTAILYQAQGRHAVREVLDNGVIRSIFNAPKCILQTYEADERIIRQIDRRVEDLFAAIIPFMIHADIVERVLRCIRRIAASEGLEERMRDLSPAISKRWEVMKEVAFAGRAIMERLDGSGVAFRIDCHYPECTRTDDGIDLIRKRCAACRYAEYCGAECQKSHWRTHRKECQALVGARNARTPIKTSRDHTIFEALTRDYVTRNSQAFADMVSEYYENVPPEFKLAMDPEAFLDQLKLIDHPYAEILIDHPEFLDLTSVGDIRLVLHGIKNPFIISVIGLIHEENVTLRDDTMVACTELFDKPGRFGSWEDDAVKSLIARWRSDEVTKDNILVAGLFEKEDDQSWWKVEVVVDFPFQGRAGDSWQRLDIE